MRVARAIFAILILCLARFSSAQVSLIVFGDWGAGTREQSQVASRLSQYAQESPDPISAILTTGDNFYFKFNDVNDSGFGRLFERMYDPMRLKMPFYMALGNHDYDGSNRQIELGYAAAHPESRWKIPSPWYRLDFPAQDPLVTVLVLDSNKSRMSKADWLAQLQWMRQQMTMSRKSPWLICIGHHPLFSNGTHGDNAVLQRDWGDLFRQAKPDLYLAGHDHTLQHLQVPGWFTTFIITAGGGAGLTSINRADRGPFARSLHGFTTLRFTPTQVTIGFIMPDGASAHQFTRDRSGQISILHTTGSDAPGSYNSPGRFTD